MILLLFIQFSGRKSDAFFTYAGLIVAAVLYEEEHKNGNMKKCSGVWDFREKLFWGNA